MATVNLHLSPTKNRDVGFEPFSAVKQMSRVPCVGEVVVLGRDGSGRVAHYEVVLVVHTPTDDEIDADLYLRRVQWESKIGPLITATKDDRTQWSPWTWPTPEPDVE